MLSSASVALELTGAEGNAKAFFRRCKANLALQNFKDASADLECVAAALWTCPSLQRGLPCPRLRCRDVPLRCVVGVCRSALLLVPEDPTMMAYRAVIDDAKSRVCA